MNFTNEKLKKIVNVYQLDYINGKSHGFGDFLRGSFCFMQLAKLIGIEFDIDLANHPMSKYIENCRHTPGIDYSNIEKINDLNNDPNSFISYETKGQNIDKNFLNKMIDLLNSKDCEVFGFFSHAFPFYNKYSDEGKYLINSKLQPNEFMQNYINNTLSKIGLSKKGYGVIHIRAGDKYLVNNNEMNIDFIKKVKKILNSIKVPGRRYLILSDSNILKNQLKSIPNFYVYIRNIDHLGGELMKCHESNGVMNTMLDYYLMSYSNAIISLSVYGHVSGFSKYCSVLNDIPFNFIKIYE
uniref:Uncharacterized protein n=1 Tax=viral metagenome TaxID=1070528 RepID=A0A6C0KSC8_9ZZZZ